MRLSTRIICRLTLILGFAAVGSTVQAQSSTKPTQARPAIDSTRVYTFVERMPVYQGSGGMKSLPADFLREFRSASAAAGCSPPSPVFVRFTVGPSGVIYDVASAKEQMAEQKLPKLSAACEAALVAAASKLPRFKPGMQNNRRVAVAITLKLAESTR